MKNLAEAEAIIGQVVSHKLFRGIALYVDGLYLEEDEVWDDESVEFHMIGDDEKFIAPYNELTVLDEEEFCWGCGQIGCGWH